MDRPISRGTRSISRILDAKVIVDTGPIVALMNRRDTLHEWAVEVFGRMRGPYLTTEGNVSEICHLLEREQIKSSLRFYALLKTDSVGVISFARRMDAVQAQVARYRDRRVDYADAGLLALSDQFPQMPVITTDVADFTVYWRDRPNRKVLMPVS